MCVCLWSLWCCPCIGCAKSRKKTPLEPCSSMRIATTRSRAPSSLYSIVRHRSSMPCFVAKRPGCWSRYRPRNSSRILRCVWARRIRRWCWGTMAPLSSHRPGPSLSIHNGPPLADRPRLLWTCSPFGRGRTMTGIIARGPPVRVGRMPRTTPLGTLAV